MEFVLKFLKYITQSKALDESSGYVAKQFFDSLYRITKFAGLSQHDKGFVYLIYWYISGLSMYLMIFFEILRTVFEFEDVATITDCVTTTGIQIISLLRYYGIKYNTETFKILGRAMESPHFDTSTKDRQEILDFWIQKNRKYLKLVFWLGNLTISTWCLFPLFDDLEYNLPVPVYAPYHYQTSFRYYLIYFGMSVFMFHSTYVVVANDLTAQCYLTHLICQFQVLGNCFENVIQECREGFRNLSDKQLFTNEVFVKRYLKRMDQLIQQHELLLSNSMLLRSALSAPMICQLASSWMLITFIGYQTAMCIGVNLVKFMMSFLFLCYNIMQLYLICNWCDQVKLYSEQVGAAVYNSGWERVIAVDCRLVRARVMIIIARASKPVVFTAGGMYDLLLPSFGSLLNASYSTLTILLSNR